ncbi:MAG: hypothetical protein HKN25_03565 [Pyrinomonadaceae bacterium]|nr:hypothetical protein [Pyrinomonadaceae bacterium]
MLRKNKRTQKITATMLAMLFVCSNLVFAQTGDMGEITVTGNVTVNGARAVSSSTILSDSQIATGANSTAVINLGARGKMELFPNTKITLKFTKESMLAMLEAGRIRVMNAAGIGSTVTTRTATAVADTGQANSYLVWLGCESDEDCQDTFVETFAGIVTLQSLADNQSVKQIPAGTKASAGSGCSEACKVPGVLPVALGPGIGPGVLAVVFGGIGAAVIAAVLVGGNNDLTPTGQIDVVSPSA